MASLSRTRRRIRTAARNLVVRIRTYRNAHALKPETLGELARVTVGLGGIASIVAGIGFLAGWEWALISGGIPPAMFYLWGEVRSQRRTGPLPDREE